MVDSVGHMHSGTPAGFVREKGAGEKTLRADGHPGPVAIERIG